MIAHLWLRSANGFTDFFSLVAVTMVRKFC